MECRTVSWCYGLLVATALGSLAAGSVIRTSAPAAYYLFNVESNTSPEEVKGALQGMTIIMAYKVEGVARHIFIVEDDGSDAIYKVQFPPKTKAIIQHVHTTKDYLARYGVTSGWEVPESLEDASLMLVKWEINVPEGTTDGQFHSLMKKFGKLYSKGFAGHKAFSYISGSVSPMRVTSFVMLSDAEANQVLAKALETLGGAYAGRVYVRHLIRI
ncbi:hypothetical protein ACOMHN_051995 [Nucella lapillus]